MKFQDPKTGMMLEVDLSSLSPTGKRTALKHLRKLFRALPETATPNSHCSCESRVQSLIQSFESQQLHYSRILQSQTDHHRTQLEILTRELENLRQDYTEHLDVHRRLAEYSTLLEYEVHSHEKWLYKLTTTINQLLESRNRNPFVWHHPPIVPPEGVLPLDSYTIKPELLPQIPRIPNSPPENPETGNQICRAQNSKPDPSSTDEPKPPDQPDG
jgi:hypothetical protein